MKTFLLTNPQSYIKFLIDNYTSIFEKSFSKSDLNLTLSEHVDRLKNEWQSGLNIGFDQMTVSEIKHEKRLLRTQIRKYENVHGKPITNYQKVHSGLVELFIFYDDEGV